MLTLDNLYIRGFSVQVSDDVLGQRVEWRDGRGNGIAHIFNIWEASNLQPVDIQGLVFNIRKQILRELPYNTPILAECMNWYRNSHTLRLFVDGQNGEVEHVLHSIFHSPLAPLIELFLLEERGLLP